MSASAIPARLAPTQAANSTAGIVHDRVVPPSYSAAVATPTPTVSMPPCMVEDCKNEITMCISSFKAGCPDMHLCDPHSLPLMKCMLKIVHGVDLDSKKKKDRELADTYKLACAAQGINLYEP